MNINHTCKKKKIMMPIHVLAKPLNGNLFPNCAKLWQKSGFSEIYIYDVSNTSLKSCLTVSSEYFNIHFPRQ